MEQRQSRFKNIDWPTTSFLLITPLIALICVPIYLFFVGWNWWLLALFLVLYFTSTLSITAGYHRLLSHRAYEAHSWLKNFFVLIGGPLAFQGSVLEWCSDHRRHHQKVDTDGDPYNITRGFWYAHIGWMFEKETPDRKKQFGKDLLKDPVIRFQHDHYTWLAIANCFALPTLIGWSFGHPVGGFLFGGVLRLVLAHHATFFINSLCHTFGRQNYQVENTAKDSLILSILTQGEGLHNFHHKFAADYRNGVRWYDWDPTKWFIRAMEKAGMARNLKRTSTIKIFQARLAIEKQRLLHKGVNEARLEALKVNLEATQKRFRELKSNYRSVKKEWKNQKAEQLLVLRQEYLQAKAEFRLYWQQWRQLSTQRVLA